MQSASFSPLNMYRRTGFNCENLIIANCEFFYSSQTFDSQKISYAIVHKHKIVYNIISNSPRGHVAFIESPKKGVHVSVLVYMMPANNTFKDERLGCSTFKA